MRGNTECSGCGYDLGKLPAAEQTRCPECGLTESVQQRRLERVSQIDVVTLGLCILLTSIVVVIWSGTISRAVEVLCILGLLLLWSTSSRRSIFVNIFVVTCLVCAFFRSSFFAYPSVYDAPSPALGFFYTATVPLKWLCQTYEFFQVPLFVLCLSRNLRRIAKEAGYRGISRYLALLDPWIIVLYTFLYTGSEFISYSSSLYNDWDFDQSAPKPYFAMEWDGVFYVIGWFCSRLYFALFVYSAWIILMLLPRIWALRGARPVNPRA